MTNETIIEESPIGQTIGQRSGEKQVSYLMFDKQKIQLVAKITIGRESDNSVVIDSKLCSRHHCVIQKIKEDYFLKDENSTNGTFLNDARIPVDKWVKLNPGDKITVGTSSLVMS
ncbi:MAG: FHA domain-containing protein [Treponema sp.]|nr:FHA domain-containing protein [Treponema sp.]MEE3314707.1 FHA domain-containing protein [Treponema sp.]